MSEVAIRVDNMGKRYRIGQREPYTTLRDTLAGTLRRPLRAFRHHRAAPPEDHIWALRDVSFEIKRGEVVGIIGRNGAGKTTLLKILSRITHPTEGHGELCGRVGSLLEVGTGFHPELTGRENIYLNGAVLGMRRKEIDGKFDAIVSFAEVERFLDTPVKRYSSGMYMRLAFAVAAHLEPEILLVDEVLAVGDATFQKKCLGKMSEVATEGRTVLFVSHNMSAVERLCPRSLLLEEGRQTLSGPTRDVIAAYLRHNSRSSTQWRRMPHHTRCAEVIFESVRVLHKDGSSDSVFAGDEPIGVEIEYVVGRPLPACQIGVRLNTRQGITVLTTCESDRQNALADPKEPGQYRSYFEIPGRLLAPGTYSLLIAAQSPMEKIFEVIEDAVSFVITNIGSRTVLDGRLGLVALSIPWQVLRKTSL